jgi:predicted CXXCH cytochrome family protein
MKTAACLFGLTLVAVLGMRVPASAQTPTGAPADLFRTDVHARAGLTCESCHGHPSGGTYAPIKRTAIAPLCARCHSDAAYMKGFNPQAHVDQYALYLTSTHGKQMSKGETRVATCSDCHGAHGITRVQDAKSPVAPAQVAATCARCHSDHDLMKAFKHPDVPNEWRQSVHAAALQHGDSSSPTCSTCHSSHGGLPVGVAKLEEVCWQCHVREADLYRASPKARIFAETDHPGCITCHENHKIEKPGDNWISLKDPVSPCSTCHDADMKGAREINLVRQGLQQVTASIDRATLTVDRAERAGMLVDDGRQALQDAREHQIQARVAVHTFAAKPFSAVADQSVKDANRAEKLGEQALAELQFRRRGLGVATALILGFLATLWVKIRSLPPVK